MKCSVIGGGINGVMSAWALAKRGHQVDLYERGELMAATSSASTKLIHGGLRYLEAGEFRLVREALRERRFWLNSAPDLVRRIELILPVYRWSRRARWLLQTGLFLYDYLAGKANLGRHRWLPAAQLQQQLPELDSTDLVGGFSFFDAQMDDHALGLWAAEMARRSGTNISTHATVQAVSIGGTVNLNGSAFGYDVVINAAGPWAEALLSSSGIASSHHLDLVRGSHLLLNRPISHGLLVESPQEERFCFILPYKGKTLVGTTEVRQTLENPIECTPEEQAYLLNIYNRYIRGQSSESDIAGKFAGLRPLIASSANQSRATREYAIEVNGRLLTIFGGKWTTAHALGEKVASRAESLGKRS
jgi:glycerol-3-phosphate dehydrogenase